MTISYKWLNEYLPGGTKELSKENLWADAEKISRILTSIGLEVENMHRYEEVKGGMKGLVIGEVLTTSKHPNADKLTLTTVDIGQPTPLNIVCGAPNVAVGQKVIVAPVGATIYPVNGDPLTMKLAKIRGEESQGMICAEDEIGLGSSHDGILVLPVDAKKGMQAAEYFKPYEDIVYEIGLTPNRMDAMSHWGVARDVCAYLSHHEKKDIKPQLPNSNAFKAGNNKKPVSVTVENENACPRYSAISISNITIAPSPLWLQQKLKAIGQRPINNIVDITNFIQHETGQPLHAFDASAITGNKVIVKNLPAGSTFVTLDEKERKLLATDLMICNETEPMCIAGVFGGLHSGVTEKTKDIFLESACFDPVIIRKTSFYHGLRTDAASRFEKGTDISATVNVLKRAALMIKEICGGEIASDIIDIYPQPKTKTEVSLKYHYLKKLSGKNYHPEAVMNILGSLGFELVKEGIDELRVAVPYHKPDISLPADLVEEILRIDGLDNVAIPASIRITPSADDNQHRESYKEKIANWLAGQGFAEIMTNSITNAAYFSEKELSTAVKMLNSLSAELNVMRPAMLETGLEVVAHNLNHKNNDLRFFEFGKTYHVSDAGKYEESEKLCLYLSGNRQQQDWKNKETAFDFYFLKGSLNNLFQLAGINANSYKIEETQNPGLEYGLQALYNREAIWQAGSVSKKLLNQFDIKQPVYFAEINWELLLRLMAETKHSFSELPRFPAVQRDLAILVNNEQPFEAIEQAVNKTGISKLTDIKLFDVYTSDKLGAGKKSMAVNFIFQDREKTLTDKEIDSWMNKIMASLEKNVQAEIRK